MIRHPGDNFPNPGVMIRHLVSFFGQIIVGAAVIDDVLGIVVLAVVAAKTGDVDLLNLVYLIISATANFLIKALWRSRKNYKLEVS